MLISNALPGLHVRFPVFSMLHIEKSPDSFFSMYVELNVGNGLVRRLVGD